jgi:sulfur relay (sulfurtransferase) DsrF/TusC family protein
VINVPKSIVIIISKAPYGHETVHGGLYTAIACLNEAARVIVVLINDGVYSALKGQHPERALGYPSIEDLLYALFPDGKVVVDASSLRERGIRREELVETVEVISEDRLLNMILEAGEVILTY